MRFSIFTLFLILSSFKAQSQIVFFSDNFDLPAGGPQLNNAGQGWTLNSGSTGNNKWFISQSINGSCETGNSLFIADQNSNIEEELYDLSSQSTSRAISPEISTLGCFDIKLRFDWRGIGEPNSWSINEYDFGKLLLSSNGGTNWQTYDFTFIESPDCQTFEITLDAAYENIPDFKMAFEWKNDFSGGAAPAFNIDNISLRADPITILPIFNSELCIGGTFQVPFGIALPFNINNVYTVELSDANGSFVNPTPIGSIAGTLDGLVNINIPDNINPAGTYFLRINGSSPLLYSEPFGPITWIVDYFNLLSNTSTSNLCNGPISLTPDETILDLVWSTGLLNVPLLNVTSPATIFATGRNSSGCLSLSDTLNIIQTTPIQITTTPPSPVPFCGIPVTVEVPAGFSSIQWSDGSTSSSIIIDTLLSESLTVNAQDVNGCFTDVYSIDIEFITDDSIYVTPENPAVCGGELEELTASDGYSNYRWFEIQTSSLVEIDNDTLLEVTSDGNYIVFADDTSGCYAVSDTIQVVAAQFPIPNFAYIQNPGSYSVSFSNTSQNGTEYYWEFDTLGTSFSEDTLFTFPENGPYNVTLQVINICDTVEITKLVFVTPVGIEGFELNSDMHVGPNPVIDAIRISSSHPEILHGTININDLQGKILLSVQSEIRPDVPIHLNLESLQSGMYIIHIQTHKGVFSTRLVKE